MPRGPFAAPLVRCSLAGTCRSWRPPAPLRAPPAELTHAACHACRHRVRRRGLQRAAAALARTGNRTAGADRRLPRPSRAQLPRPPSRRRPPRPPALGRNPRAAVVSCLPPRPARRRGRSAIATSCELPGLGRDEGGGDSEDAVRRRSLSDSCPQDQRIRFGVLRPWGREGGQQAGIFLYGLKWWADVTGHFGPYSKIRAGPCRPSCHGCGSSPAQSTGPGWPAR